MNAGGSLRGIVTPIEIESGRYHATGSGRDVKEGYRLIIGSEETTGGIETEMRDGTEMTGTEMTTPDGVEGIEMTGIDRGTMTGEHERTTEQEGLHEHIRIPMIHELVDGRGHLPDIWVRLVLSSIMHLHS